MEQIFDEENFGDLTLEEAASFCGTLQNMLTCKLIRISKKTDESNGKVNIYVFERVTRATIPAEPTLEKVDKPEEVTAVIAKRLAEGKRVIFDSTIFIENKDARILCFR
jgi:hypothetical protein